MCLLVNQPAGVTFDDDFLRGVFRRNPDGIGVMWAEDNTLHYHKELPRNKEAFVEFYRKHVAGKACAWHARMQTHGDIDIHNCHPYCVLSAADGYPIFMMHNGVLRTGNSGDETKSDTWHYIHDYLRPILLKNPRFFLTPAFKALIEAHIGTNNKFILLDAFGNIVTINKERGVEHNDAWLSNTYAWDTAGTKHGHSYYGGFSSRYDGTYYDAYGRANTKRPSFSRGKRGGDDYEDFYAWENTLNKKQESPTDIGTVSEAPSAEIKAQDEEEYAEWEYMLDEHLYRELSADAFRSITSDHMISYFMAVGKERAWELLEQIYDNEITAERVAALITAPRPAPAVPVEEWD
ncbi:MAG: hypothetical protein LBV29_03150 [Azoarcus sp.]|jgi:hypothetical protein|nr:hypothetical protein [Azoarcus sp.]